MTKKQRRRNAQGIERRRQVLLFIGDYYNEHGYSPSIYEIAEKVGIVKSNVSRYIDLLQQEGYLHKDPTRRRSVTLTERGWRVL